MKKKAVRENFNLFHLCFTNEIRGDRHTLHTCKMEGGGWTGACPWWEGALPPPLENEKKRLSEEILTSFTYVLLMKLGGGDRYTIMQNGRGWADIRRLSMVGVGARGICPL